MLKRNMAHQILKKTWEIFLLLVYIIIFYKKE